MEREEYCRMFEVEDRHWWYVALHELIVRTVREEHARKGPLTMLDAGCGTGGLLRQLSGFGQASGCDASRDALSFCRKRSLEHVRKADLNTVELSRDQFDLITSIDVLYHRDIRNEIDILSKLFAALKPDGVLIFQVPAFESLRSTHDVAVHTGKRYRLQEVIKMIQEAGFVVEQATYRVGSFFRRSLHTASPSA